MEAIARVDIVDRYREPRKLTVPVSEEKRKQLKKQGKTKEEDFFEVKLQPILFAKAGDKIKVITEYHSHLNVVVCANEKDERLSIMTVDLILHA